MISERLHQQGKKLASFFHACEIIIGSSLWPSVLTLHQGGKEICFVIFFSAREIILGSRW
jgi:hypothetical protein